MKKPTIPEVHPLVQAWYRRPENGAGGMFHVILEDSNQEQRHADTALATARESGDAEAIHLAELLAAMSPTQRLKLSQLKKS